MLQGYHATVSQLTMWMLELQTSKYHLYRNSTHRNGLSKRIKISCWFIGRTCCTQLHALWLIHRHTWSVGQSLIRFYKYTALFSFLTIFCYRQCKIPAQQVITCIFVKIGYFWLIRCLFLFSTHAIMLDTGVGGKVPLRPESRLLTVLM